MHSDLHDNLGFIESRLVSDDIVAFKIGATGELDSRMADYLKEGYLFWSFLAYGEKDAVCLAERDLIEWALRFEKLKEKCENRLNAAKRGKVENVNTLYIVAKPTPQKVADMENIKWYMSRVGRLLDNSKIPINLSK